MTLQRTAAALCAVFLAASLAGYGTGVSWQALAQDKSAKQPASEAPGTAEPDAPEDKTQPAATPAPETPSLPIPSEPVRDIADQPALMEQIAAAQAELASRFEAGETDGFREAIAAHPDANGAAVFGQLLYMRRHFARSAWFFAEAARNDPDDASALNNFGVLLDETYANDPENRPAEWVALGVEAIERANALRPGDPAIENNLGRGHYNLAQVDADAADLDAAAAALEHAVTMDPVNSVFLSNQALVLDAQGDAEGAAAALARAHLRNPTHPSLLTARGQVSGATSGAYAGASRSYCSVDYQCAQRCPRSIVGQINRVTCEMEQSSAQMSCSAGEPYAPSFNCAEEIPEFGILIPGLNAGFTIASPWGSISAVTDGEGNVQWRIEAGPNIGALNPYIRADGTYQPNGGWSVSDTRAGIKVNLVNNTPAGQTAGEWGYQPVYIQAEAGGEDHSEELSVGAYGNATIWH